MAAASSEKAMTPMRSFGVLVRSTRSIKFTSTSVVRLLIVDEPSTEVIHTYGVTMSVDELTIVACVAIAFVGIGATLAAISALMLAIRVPTLRCTSQHD